MNLNRKDLRIISYEFNCIANRLLRSSYDEFIPVLKKFLGHLSNTELINEYVTSCTRENFDIDSELEAVNSSYGRRILDLGYTDEEEIYTIYNVLKYISENGFNVYGMGKAYSREKLYNDIVNDFNNKVSLILINHISAYLTKIGIEMGFDEEVNYMITNNGGQVNISKDTSTLNAVQNIGAKSDELINLVNEINRLITSSDISDTQKEMIVESIEAIQAEIENPSPKKGLIKTCIAGLKGSILAIPTAIELCDNINKFIEFVSSKIN
ncbi:hypothetical protein BH721_03860 [Clostridium baratii]|nr:hypothetical protein A1M12_10065 [Clostridium baratii]OPF55849.1 hypothetical protein BH721_03860 [Clostridium baratii]OPF56770.1 hypothetical protein BH724_09565 [Clostridium baratii]OPF59769.1 hypothetical protein BH725_04065 [Clostridium baratii]